MQEVELSAATNGHEFWLDYDTTDFPRNPASGSRQKFTLTCDFGWFDSSNSRTNLGFEASKYFYPGTPMFRQQGGGTEFMDVQDAEVGDRCL